MLLPSLTKAKGLLTDRSYNADGFRIALMKKGNTSCSELGIGCESRKISRRELGKKEAV